MDAAQALADLTEISSQIQAAVLFDEHGSVAGSTLADEERSRELVRAAGELLDAAERLGTGEGALTQLEASTLDGSVFVVRDGARRIVATTGPDPTVGLVFYDLKSCLRGVDDGGGDAPKSAAKRPGRTNEDEESGDAA
jgi:predicted regulator of Ras-like GTPase activity (Roadblock/LC7/MglB family)